MDQHDSQNEMNPEESTSFRALSEYPVPPQELEDRTVDLLKERNLLEQKSFSYINRKILWYVAAALVLMSVGFGLGRWGFDSPKTAVDQKLFMLALIEPADQRLEEDQLYEEYGNWLREIGKDGRYVGGEALKYEIQKLVTDQRGEFYRNDLVNNPKTIMSGYFLIEAQNMEEIEAIARQSPHLKYGGAIVIREIL